MIRFTTKEMRIITGIPAKNLGVYKLRGNLFKDGDGLWPYDNELNKSFIEQRGIPGAIANVLNAREEVKEKTIKKTPLPKKKLVQVKKNISPKKKVPSEKKTKHIVVKKKVGRPKKEIKEPEVKKEIPVKFVQPELSELSKVNLEQKKFAIKKAKTEYELKQIELQEKKGSLISLEKTVIITKTYSDKLKHEFLQSMENLIQDVCARHSIDSGKTGEYKLKVAEVINKSNDLAIDELLKRFK